MLVDQPVRGQSSTGRGSASRTGRCRATTRTTCKQCCAVAYRRAAGASRCRLAGHRRWRSRSRVMATALVVPWTWVREGKARSGAILHPLNLFRIVIPLDYAVGEWLGSTSRAPNWLQQPLGITIAPAAQHFRDGLLGLQDAESRPSANHPIEARLAK